MSIPTLLSVKQLCTKHPVLKVGGVRCHIFHEHDNGLAETGAVVRIGRKVAVDEKKYFGWLLTLNDKAAA